MKISKGQEIFCFLFSPSISFTFIPGRCRNKDWIVETDQNYSISRKKGVDPISMLPGLDLICHLSSRSGYVDCIFRLPSEMIGKRLPHALTSIKDVMNTCKRVPYQSKDNSNWTCNTGNLARFEVLSIDVYHYFYSFSIRSERTPMLAPGFSRIDTSTF